MCGLIGTYQHETSNISAERVRLGLKRIKHRGPDDEGMVTVPFVSGVYHAGHTRLSIIDLSTLGRQPMISGDGRYLLSFNGEIYNYRELKQDLQNLGYVFQSDTDTEVLLNAWSHWGRDCLTKLTGMFAFTVFDKENSTLTCVRDPFGIKPFFYQRSDTTFSYSSEIPALLSLSDEKPKMNLQKAYDFLVYEEHDRDQETFFEGVTRLMPGEIMNVRLEDENISTQTDRWWIPSIQERNSISFTDAADELRERFLQNVKLHLRSDVPLGAALSGGIDSSAIVCGMRYLEPDMPIHTFSYISNDAAEDEEKWVDIVNDHTGAISKKCVVTTEELTEDIDKLIKLQGEPFATTSIYAQFRVFQLAKENGVTVTLDGQGADEMLAGYDGYPELKVESLFNSRQFLNLATFMKEWPNSDQRDFKRVYRALLKSFLSDGMRKKIRRKKHLSAEMEWINKSWFHERGVVTNGDSILTESTTKTRLVMEKLSSELTVDRIPRLLRYEDRNSMYWSLESRVPFLTRELVEFLLGLPEEYLISNQGVTKHIFREAMRDIVPNEILNRKDKIGFDTPGKQLLAGLASNLEERLAPLKALPFIPWIEVKNFVEETVSGTRPFSWDVWRILCFAGWVEAFEVEVN